MLFHSYPRCSVALTVPIQKTSKYARFTQVVCERVPIFYQQARWMAGQMAPNDVTSCFNKTLEGRAASLNTNKDYYAIHFLSFPSNSPISFCHLPSNSLSPSNQHLSVFVLSMEIFVYVCSVCAGTHAFLSDVIATHEYKLCCFNKWDSKMPHCYRASLLWVLLTFSTLERNSLLDN